MKIISSIFPPQNNHTQQTTHHMHKSTFMNIFPNISKDSEKAKTIQNDSISQTESVVTSSHIVRRTRLKHSIFSIRMKTKRKIGIDSEPHQSATRLEKRAKPSFPVSALIYLNK